MSRAWHTMRKPASYAGQRDLIVNLRDGVMFEENCMG